MSSLVRFLVPITAVVACVAIAVRRTERSAATAEKPAAGSIATAAPTADEGGLDPDRFLPPREFVEPVGSGATLSAAIQHRVARDAGSAVDWVEARMREEPARARDYAAMLVFALGVVGEHERASSFAAAADEAMRVDLLTAAYRTWAQSTAEVALDAALMLDDPLRRRAAFHAAITGWSRVAPQQATECAMAFPNGPEKRFALTTALRAWRHADATAMKQWLTVHAAALAESDLRVVWQD